MRYLIYTILISVLILLPTKTYAEEGFLKHVTLTNRATYKLEYSGVLGAVMDECVRFLAKSWHESLERRYIDGSAPEDDGLYWYWSRRVEHCKEDYEQGDWSDYREHWWQYTVDWGPIQVYTIGRVSDVINWGPIRVTGKFKFKVKHYEARLNSNWTFKFKPRVSVSSKPPFLRKVSLGFEFEYRRHWLKLAEINIDVGYDLDDQEGFFWIGVSLTNW